MAQGKEIQQRLKSIKNTKKTTKAMELVAGAKMRKAVLGALDTRLYSTMTWDIMKRLQKNVDTQERYQHLQKFFGEAVDAKHITIAVFTSNRGLCGAFNANVIKKVVAYVKTHPEQEIEIISIGKKGAAMLQAFGITVAQAYEKSDSAKDDSSIAAVSAYLHEQFAAGKTDQVFVAYTDYKSAIAQFPVMQQLYPILSTDVTEELIEKTELRSVDAKRTEHAPSRVEYIYEPSGERLLNFLIPRIAQVQMYQALLESNASEHSSRMIAMKNASEAAGEMAQDLMLAFNRARQAGITKEIAEITAGSAAVA
jgi:F-type H+-transporting ATPase subunit gamma